MRRPLTPGFALLLLVFTSCQKDTAILPASGLEGTWHLTSRQCYCTPAPSPDEQVIFSGNQAAFYKDGQLIRVGEYTVTTAASACLSASPPAPALRFTNPPSNVGPAVVQYRLTGNTLTLDYGSPCDFPLDSYERL